MNNTVNKLILDRGSCEKLHKKLRFADPVFITSGILNPGELSFSRLLNSDWSIEISGAAAVCEDVARP